MTVEQLGKSRSWAANQLVLVELPDELQVMLSADTVGERDGRALACRTKDSQKLVAAALLEHQKAVNEAEACSKAEERKHLLRTSAREECWLVVRGQQDQGHAGLDPISLAVPGWVDRAEPCVELSVV